MSGVRPTPKKNAETKRLRAVLMAGAAFCVGFAPLIAPGFAQEAAPLRGEVSETAINQELLSAPSLSTRRTRLEAPPPEEPVEQRGIPAPQYEPISEQPVPVEAPNASQSLFDEPPEESTSSGEPIEAATPTRRPSTATQRAEDANDAAMKAPELEEDDTAGAATEEGAEDVETTGTVPAPTIGSENDLTVDPGAERVEPIEGLEREEEDDPYAALGVRAGTFILRPSIESGITYTTNANSGANEDPAFLSEINAETERRLRLGSPFRQARRLRHLPQIRVWRRGEGNRGRPRRRTAA